MDELGAALRRVSKFLGRQRVNAPAASVSRLEDSYPFARACELAGGHQARSARTDDHAMGWRQKRHRTILNSVASRGCASALLRDQSPCPVGMNWKSSVGTASKNA